MSDLNDPRVLFAAERTLLAWVRTASGLMALGFLIDRAALVVSQPRSADVLAAAIGIAFVLVGVLLSVLSTIQYRRTLASLRPAEIPPGYFVNLAVVTSLAVGLLGLGLTMYLFRG